MTHDNPIMPQKLRTSCLQYVGSIFALSVGFLFSNKPPDDDDGIVFAPRPVSPQFESYGRHVPVGYTGGGGDLGGHQDEGPGGDRDLRVLQFGKFGRKISATSKNLRTSSIVPVLCEKTVESPAAGQRPDRERHERPAFLRRVLGLHILVGGVPTPTPEVRLCRLRVPSYRVVSSSSSGFHC